MEVATLWKDACAQLHTLTPKLARCIIIGMEGTLGQNIRKLRKERGLTQEALAEAALGGNQSQLSRYENDVWTPSLDSLIRIAQALNCQLSDLIYVTSSTQEVLA